jgi:hypothetical protein
MTDIGAGRFWQTRRYYLAGAPARQVKEWLLTDRHSAESCGTDWARRRRWFEIAVDVDAENSDVSVGG